MSPTAVAVLCVLLGFMAVVAGSALISPAAALVVGGGGLVVLGFLIDEPRRDKRD